MSDDQKEIRRTPKFEWKVWNLHKEWQPLKAKSWEGAFQELQRHMPYSEEAMVRCGKQVCQFKPIASEIDWGPYA